MHVHALIPQIEMTQFEDNKEEQEDENLSEDEKDIRFMPTAG